MAKKSREKVESIPAAAFENMKRIMDKRARVVLDLAFIDQNQTNNRSIMRHTLESARNLSDEDRFKAAIVLGPRPASAATADERLKQLLTLNERIVAARSEEALWLRTSYEPSEFLSSDPPLSRPINRLGIGWIAPKATLEVDIKSSSATLGIPLRPGAEVEASYYAIHVGGSNPESPLYGIYFPDPQPHRVNQVPIETINHVEGLVLFTGGTAIDAALQDAPEATRQNIQELRYHVGGSLF